MLGSGGQCHQCYQPGIRRIESESAFLVRAVKSRPQGQSDARPMKGIGLVSNGAVQRSDEQAKADTDLIHQVSRERAKALLAAFLCHDAMMPLKRRTDSAPAPPGASVAFLRLSGLEREYGFRWASQSSIQSADISELSDGVLCPFQADSHRRGTVPVLCPLRLVMGLSLHRTAVQAIRLHRTVLQTGGNRAGGNPQGYVTVPLPDHRYLIIIGRHWDFLKLISWEYVRSGTGVLSPGTSLHNGTARPGLMPCMNGRLFYADRHSRQPDQFMDGLSVPGKRVDQQGFLLSIDLSDKNT